MSLSIDLIRNRAIFSISVLVSLWHIYANTFSLLPDEWNSVIHFSSLAFLAILISPVKLKLPVFTSQDTLSRMGFAVDLLIGFSAILVAGYLILYTDDLYARGVIFNQWDWFFSVLTLLLAIEFSRRTTGWLIPILAIIAFTYVIFWGKYVSGIFNFPGLSLETTLFRVYFSEDGMFGKIAQISWSYVFMFILLGAFLNKSGASRFILDISIAIAGRFVGGSGLVAIIASGFMGSISGSAIANVASTGVITIPMMKKSGFSAPFAGAVEASASTGGQIMPPVMGAGAFLMATYTQIPYSNIVSAAFLPAILYFASICFFVRVNAKKNHLKVVNTDELPRLRDVLSKGWFFTIPFIVLIWLLLIGYTPTYAAGFGIVSVVISSYFSTHKMRLKDILSALSDGAKGAVSVSMLLIVIGVMVVSINTTGVGNVFSLMITQWSGGSLLIALTLIALASLILGMGLPVTASYIVLATLCAPLVYGMLAEQSIIQLLISGNLDAGSVGIIQMLNPNMDFSKTLGYEQAVLAMKPFLTLENNSLRSLLFEQALSLSDRSIMLLISHMIIFWLSQDSNVTPPVCLAAYTAAAIAKAKPSTTGFYAWKIAKGIYIISFLMAYTPLIGDNFYLSLYSFFILLFGLYGSVVVFEKYSEGPVSKLGYGLFFLATLVLLIPNNVLIPSSVYSVIPSFMMIGQSVWFVHLAAILLIGFIIFKGIKYSQNLR